MYIFKHPNCQLRLPYLIAIVAIAISMIGFVSTSEVHAQRRKSVFDEPKTETEAEKTTPAKKKQSQADVRKAAANKKQQAELDKEFAPQVVFMTVKGEGVQLVATWFPPIIEKDKKKRRPAPANANEEEDKEPGKSKAPFILVHDWTRSRTDMLMLASFLQKQGHAVIVPDLRGHGESVSILGSTKPLDHTKFKKSDKASAVGDIDQCKRFLQEKNNEGIVNIDLLNVIAVGDSSHLAIAWALSDWSWEPVAGIKQGKDVKSLILFSPTKRFAGSALKKLVKEPLISGRNAPPLPLLVIWGSQSDSAEDCEGFVELLRKFRPAAPESDDMAQRWMKQNLFDFQTPTAMRGFELAGNPNAQRIWSFANDFVSQKVLAYKDRCPWQIRGADAVFKARAAEE